MEQVHQFDIDGVSYKMTPANAMAAWSAVKNALKLLNGVNLSGADNKAMGASVLTGILANLGDPSVKALEDIIYKHTVAIVESGEPYRLSDKFDAHFNQYRSHLLEVLQKGLIYQFADFFKGGGGLLKNITALAK